MYCGESRELLRQISQTGQIKSMAGFVSLHHSVWPRVHVCQFLFESRMALFCLKPISSEWCINPAAVIFSWDRSCSSARNFWLHIENNLEVLGMKFKHHFDFILKMQEKRNLHFSLIFFSYCTPGTKTKTISTKILFLLFLYFCFIVCLFTILRFYILAPNTPP